MKICQIIHYDAMTVTNFLLFYRNLKPKPKNCSQPTSTKLNVTKLDATKTAKICWTHSTKILNLMLNTYSSPLSSDSSIIFLWRRKYIGYSCSWYKLNSQRKYIASENMNYLFIIIFRFYVFGSVHWIQMQGIQNVCTSQIRPIDAK